MKLYNPRLLCLSIFTKMKAAVRTQFFSLFLQVPIQVLSFNSSLKTLWVELVTMSLQWEVVKTKLPSKQSSRQPKKVNGFVLRTYI